MALSPVSHSETSYISNIVFFQAEYTNLGEGGRIKLLIKCCGTEVAK